MANLKDIRKRIGSVKNTQKITRAMKLVSAAKFAKVSIAAKSAAPYGDGLAAMVHELSEILGDKIKSDLFESRQEKKVTVVVISSDRGLCGGLNANINKKLATFSKEKKLQQISVDVVSLGRKVSSFVNNNGQLFTSVLFKREKVIEKPNNDGAKDIVDIMTKRFRDKETDAVYLIYPKFISALSQVPTVAKLLPIDQSEVTNVANIKTTSSSSHSKNSNMVVNYIVEPSPEKLLDQLLVKQLTNKMYRAFLESSASEHGARMTAMDSATNNASDVISSLTLVYNRGRQAAITKELIEITSGAEAL
ncbi:MAG: ATP synthase F1 subunit gamma [Oligoflexales bacterium]|nr:ATP synthase F1 subunit gamma [Oligoflexales bacterium]